MSTLGTLNTMRRNVVAVFGALFFAYLVYDFGSDLTDPSAGDADGSLSILIGGGGLLLGFGTLWRLIRTFSRRQRSVAERGLATETKPDFDADEAIARYLANRPTEPSPSTSPEPPMASRPSPAPPTRGFGRKGTFG